MSNPDYTVDTLRALARRGDAEALFRLGEIARLFNDDPEGAVRAWHWHTCAALHGHPKSMWTLGTLLENGIGTDPDRCAAARWFRRAADLGSPEAHLQLFLMQLAGRLPDDIPGTSAKTLNALGSDTLRNALESFIVNAWHGYRYAKLYLALAYELGAYADCDLSRARDWYADAARDGVKVAQSRLAALCERQGNYRLARHWSALAAGRSRCVEALCGLPASAESAADPAEELVFFRRMLEPVE